MPEMKDSRRGAQIDDSATQHEESPRFKVEDKRHWARAGAEAEGEPEAAEAPSPYPTLVDELRGRAEQAERTLQEYIGAFREAQVEQERVRERLTRDVERRVEERFASLVAELLATADDLELALAHAGDSPESRPLAEGVALVRDQFLAALGRQGVERLQVEGEPFDPNLAEAVQMEPVDDSGLDGKVVRVLQAGYRLGERLVRPARVVVGRKHG